MPVRQALDAHYYPLRLFLISIIVILLSILFPSSLQANQSDEYWLALNIYHEARGESIQGKFAVAMVTINRVESPDYPKTIKGVVTQSKQFSWYSKRKIRSIKKGKEYGICLDVAKTAITMRKSKIFGNFIRQIGADDVIYYHRIDIKPRWAYYKGDVIDIGKHVFYKDG